MFFGSKKSCGKEALRAAMTMTQADFDGEMRQRMANRANPEVSGARAPRVRGPG